MIVKSLELRDFRNYDVLSVTFAPGVNLIYGDNAQGKTNVLEAIYECAAARSHRGTKDRDVIRFEAEEAHIRLQMEKKGSPTRIDLHLKKNKSKGAAIDGIPVARLSELFGQLNAVFFSPEDLRIIKSSPSERRRFLDEELCQLNPSYTYALGSFNRALMQRNNILKDIWSKPQMKDVAAVWDEQLVKFGKEVICLRREFLDELQEIIAPIHKDLTDGREEIRLEYDPSSEPEVYADRLFLAWDNDCRLGSTTLGPHRDDFSVLINGIDVRNFGSQGQQRTAALSLKLAEIELVRKKIHDTPVLLLDDVLSELDSIRRGRLVAHLKGVQTFLTCTGLEDFVESSLDIDKKYYVNKGKMVEEEQNHE